MKIPIIIASLYGLLSVILGAFGAHALKERLNPAQLASWETGVRYQLFHALALLIMALLMDKGWNLRPTVVCFAAGTLLFSGSIYLLCLQVGPKSLWGPVTPIGGLTLIIGWSWLLFQAIKH